MRNHAANRAAVVILSSLCGASAFAQNIPDAIDAHLIAARKAHRIRLLPAPSPVCALRRSRCKRAAGCGARPCAPLGYMVRRPAKVFDNLYFVGSKIHSSWG